MERKLPVLRWNWRLLARTIGLTLALVPLSVFLSYNARTNPSWPSEGGHGHLRAVDVHG